jgi:hypothetical protein
MSLLASLLLGCSVSLLTIGLWPRRPAPKPISWQFVEEPGVPRTVH